MTNKTPIEKAAEKICHNYEIGAQTCVNCGGNGGRTEPPSRNLVIYTGYCTVCNGRGKVLFDGPKQNVAEIIRQTIEEEVPMNKGWFSGIYNQCRRAIGLRDDTEEA